MRQILPRAGHRPEPGRGTGCHQVPRSAQNPLKAGRNHRSFGIIALADLNPDMDSARYQLLTRLAGGPLPWPEPRPRPGADPLVSTMTSFLATVCIPGPSGQ